MAAQDIKKTFNFLGISCPNLNITSCVIDSTLAVPGSLFFALKGQKTSGSLFLEDAKNRGAVAAVVPESYRGGDFGLFLIRVDDPLQTLHKLAAQVIKDSRASVVAITGSVGKTTTKEFVATLLSPLGRVWKSPGNANSQVGLPISLLNAEEADFLVLEMGMSAHGEIAKLVQIAPPDLVIITKIGLAHSQFFPEGIEAIARAKAEILQGGEEPLAIMPQEVAELEAFRSYPHKLVFQRDYVADIQGNIVFIRNHRESLGPFILPFHETHFIDNFCLAALAALKMGVSEEALKAEVKKLKAPDKRFERQVFKGVLFINDSYNAGPISVGAALDNLPKPREFKKRIAALGSMKELGVFSEKAHQEIGKKAAEICDVIFCTGIEALPLYEEAKKSGKPCAFFESFEDLAEALYQSAEEGDVVLIKGSKSHQMWRLLERFY